MKHFFEFMQIAAFFSMFVAIMGFGAFLIYKRSDGWGWYLFVAALLLGSIKFKVGG